MKPRGIRPRVVLDHYQKNVDNGFGWGGSHRTIKPDVYGKFVRGNAIKALKLE